MITFIHWNPSPDIFSLGNFNLHWYSVLMATAFLVCYYLASLMVKREGYSSKIQENGTIYFIAGLVIGARLGHCFFYAPSFYVQHPLDILKVWQGGLSSHGAVLGVMVSMWIYAKKIGMPWFWFIDKLAVVFLLAGFFVRIGNLMNSEAIGIPTTVPWGFVFMRRGEEFARHPAQIYESLIYLCLFLWLNNYHRRSHESLKPGMLTGLSLMTAFLARFFVEFVKDAPSIIGETLSLNTGQVLSIPIVIFGTFLVWWKRGGYEKTINR